MFQIIALSSKCFKDKNQTIRISANDFLQNQLKEKRYLLMLKKYLNQEFDYEEKEGKKIVYLKGLKNLSEFGKLNENFIDE